MALSILGAALFTVTIGLWMVGMALTNLADLKSTLKIVFLVGLVTGVIFVVLLVPPYQDFFGAAVVGVAGMFNFMQAGLGGFYDDYDAKSSSQVLSYVGLFLVISGIYAISELAGPTIFNYIGAWLILAGIILFLITSAVYNIAPKSCAAGVIIISAVNTVLSYMIWLGFIY